jgi:murein endopeptidase
MRALVVVSTVLLLWLGTTDADARPRKNKRLAVSKPGSGERLERGRGQSIGKPWAGKLRDATRLRDDDGYHIRRPHRAYATRTTIEHTREAIGRTLRSWPELHVLAIGDFSARHGGRISQHSSHQSGRDVDLGLFYDHEPPGYPSSFVEATANTLHMAAMWSLIANLVRTVDDDGGVHMIFLDFELQGAIYTWALDNGASERRLNRIFQYPHGRGASAGIVRHEPNHKDHLHVRFRCARADRDCRR